MRRGDYKSPAHSVHDSSISGPTTRGPCSRNEEDLPSGFRLYVVSDDIRHCKDDHVFRAFDDVVFVEGLDELDTLYLMATCRFGGTPARNSTFSWFGAYLNENPDKFVALPSRWWKRDSCRKDSTSTASARSTWVLQKRHKGRQDTDGGQGS